MEFHMTLTQALETFDVTRSVSGYRFFSSLATFLNYGFGGILSWFFLYKISLPFILWLGIGVRVRTLTWSFSQNLLFNLYTNLNQVMEIPIMENLYSISYFETQSTQKPSHSYTLIFWDSCPHHIHLNFCLYSSILIFF